MISTVVDRLSLQDLCQPRASVAQSSRADTVAEIADLAKLDARAFFAETHVTEGMGLLLRQVFERLMGRSDQGVFRLKQAMGGGKTHNLLAAALLASEPVERRRILVDVGVAVDDRPIRVAAFSGRETDTSEYLWVHLFRALGCEHRWRPSSEIPGPSTWANVIGDEPALILLDELPPFFVSLGGKAAGPQTTEADRLALALANLMTAIISNRLPNCCLVISDLAGAWAEGSLRIQQAIDNATKEISRSAFDVTPVRLDSVELYAILRSRLFERSADERGRRAVAQAYAQAYRTAVQQGIMLGSYERWAQEIAESYPFHPGMHELFARFRENPNFQQTREMLRLARRMVAGLWSGGGAGSAMLVHPHTLDFADQDVAATLERINPALTNARARDVAAGGGATAEALARELGSPIAADAARLLYLSSLAIGPNVLQGLTPEEIAAYLCAPERDVSGANVGLLTRLEEDSWYLHRRTDGRWYYRDVKNVTSAIRDRAETMNEDARRKEVEAYLRKTFDPAGGTMQRIGEQRWAYQRLLVFPSIEDIQRALRWDEVLLVISQPSPTGLNPDLRRFWANQTCQNRLMFLCGSETFAGASRAAAYMKAAEDQVAEFEAQRMSDGAPEMQQARAALDRNRNGFLSALRETFTQLHFPDVSSGKLETASLKLDFAGNEFVGQLAILDTLKDQQKFREDVESDAFRTEFEHFIFKAAEANWRDLMEAAARQPEWYFVPPGGHETMKTAAIRKDVWRDEGGGYIRKGPFPKDRTSVIVNRAFRNDATGEVILNVTAKHGDRVHYEEGGAPATINSPVVQGGRLETAALRLSFLAIDTTGEHEPGDPVSWENEITLKYELAYRDGARRVTLKALPRGTIRYTLDGSNPRSGGVYEDEIVVPEGRDVLLAIAEEAGIWSDPLRVNLPAAGGDGEAAFRPDPTRPAEWRRRLGAQDRRGAFAILDTLKRLRATICGADLNSSMPGSDEDWISYGFGGNVVRSPEEVEKRALELIDQLAADGAQPDVTLHILRLRFDSGAALVEAAKELDQPLNADEVKQ